MRSIQLVVAYPRAQQVETALAPLHPLEASPKGKEPNSKHSPSISKRKRLRAGWTTPRSGNRAPLLGDRDTRRMPAWRRRPDLI